MTPKDFNRYKVLSKNERISIRNEKEMIRQTLKLIAIKFENYRTTLEVFD